MTPDALLAYARNEIDDLGPEPSGPELELWREERWGREKPADGPLVPRAWSAELTQLRQMARSRSTQ